MDKAYDYKELQQYRQNITQYSVLSHEEVCELIKRYRQGDQEAGQQVINANLRFVIKVCQKYFKSGHANLELVQEGNFGLIRALDKFDTDRGVPFIYYAAWWIEAMVKTFIYKSSKAHTGNLGHAKDLYSLDEPIGNDDNDKNCWVDFLPDDTDIEKQYFDDERSRNISSLFKHCLTSLSAREAYIINKRFYADPPQTLIEVASHLGVSKERVRQLQMRSMEKMKKVLEGQGDSFSELEVIGSQTHQRYGMSNFSYGEYFQN
jgi:RNA polymerase sigma factor (sigma-70 family)